MIRSRIALAALVLGTALPSVAFAAATPETPASCSLCGAPYNDVERGPFARRDYIASVAPYQVTDSDGKHSRTRLEGAVVTVRPAPGVTREWLRRTIEDHMGRMAATAPMNDCPLSVAGAAADVSSIRDGFAITVHSKDANAAQEILRRASLLTAT